MSTQLKLFEGPALEPLLEQITREVGPNAKILRAERSRHGGVMGFFARERYHLTVEPPPSAKRRRPAKTARDTAKPTARAACPPSAPVRGTRQPEPPASRTSGAESTLRTPHHSPNRPAKGDQGLWDPPNPFAALADAMHDELAVVSPSDPIADAADRHVPPAKFADVLRQAAMEASGATLAGTDRGTPEPSTTQAGTNATLGTPKAVPSPRPAREVGPSVDPHRDLDPPRTLQIASRCDPPAVHRSRCAAPRNLPRPLVLAEQLRQTGLPDNDVVQVLRALDEGRRHMDLLVEVFRQAPVPPALPSTPGAVVAVVGTRAAATRSAARIATDLGLPPASVVTIPESNTPGARRDGAPDQRPPLQAAISSGSGSSPASPVVVTVRSAMTGASRLRAAHMLATIAPAAVWGVADATAKPEDVTAWATALGGLDALVVTNVAATVSPAAILRCGIPVARLDGLAATPEHWAATIGRLIAA